MFNNKEKAYGTLAAFFIIAFLFWKYSDAFTTWSSSANPLLVTIAYIVLNPAYLVLIWWLYKSYGVKGAVSGVIISISLDIISLSHSILSNGLLPSGISPLFAYSDTTAYKFLTTFISQSPMAVFILYVIVPTALIWLALFLIKRKSSFNKIVRESL